jgi:RP/EB family microtubule-associated protein
MASAIQVVNVYVTGNTSTGENQVSRQDMLAWFQDCLKMDIKKIEDLGRGPHYCQMIDLLFPSVNTVPLKNVKFGAKSEHEFAENWKKLQNGFKKLNIDKVIPIERLIKLKMMDNMEFAQWFKKFFDSNCGLDPNFGTYDSEAERARVGISVPAAGAPSGVGAGTRKPAAAAPPRQVAAPITRPALTKRPVPNAAAAVNGTGDSRAPPTMKAPAQRSPAAPVQRTEAAGTSAQDQQVISDLQTQVADGNARLEESVVTVDGLEKERDFYFGKLRDIEILAQEHEDSGQAPDEDVLRRILEILYATEDGFVAPEEEEGLEDGGVVDEEDTY